MQFYFCLGLVKCLITIFRSITLLCGTNSNPRNSFHIQIECEEYSIEYCQSHITLLWIWIMLCFTVTPLQRFELKHTKNCKFMWSFDNTLLLWIWSCMPRENSTHKCSIQKKPVVLYHQLHSPHSPHVVSLVCHEIFVYIQHTYRTPTKSYSSKHDLQLWKMNQLSILKVIAVLTLKTYKHVHCNIVVM